MGLHLDDGVYKSETKVISSPVPLPPKEVFLFTSIIYLMGLPFACSQAQSSEVSFVCLLYSLPLIRLHKLRSFSFLSVSSSTLLG